MLGKSDYYYIMTAEKISKLARIASEKNDQKSINLLYKEAIKYNLKYFYEDEQDLEWFVNCLTVEQLIRLKINSTS